MYFSFDNLLKQAKLFQYTIAIEMEQIGDSVFWRNACKSTAFDQNGCCNHLEIMDRIMNYIVINPEKQAFVYQNNMLIVGDLKPVQHRPSEIMNGVRIDTSSIADTIRNACDGIDGCVALVVDEGGRHVLVAFVSGIRSKPAVSNIIATAKRALPHRLIPSYIINLESIPYICGLVDIDKLRTIFTEFSIEDKQEYVVESQDSRQWSSIESTIRTVIADVAGLSEGEIQRTQTIFHLGLDSINAIQLSSNLRKEGIDLTVAEIIREATVEKMAMAVGFKSDNLIAIERSPLDTRNLLIKSMEGVDITHCLNGISQEKIDAVYPITPGQLYMLEAWKNSSGALFMPTFVFKCTLIEIHDIQSAWESLLQREPILRTTFRPTENDEIPYIQVIFKKDPVQFNWYQSSQPISEKFLGLVKDQEQAKPVDFMLPLARLCVVNSPRETIILLTIHHALYDGVSLPIILSRLRNLLEERRRSDRLPLTPELIEPGPQFAEYVALAICRIENNKKNSGQIIFEVLNRPWFRS
jgi:aryl carrier-like protein